MTQSDIDQSNQREVRLAEILGSPEYQRARAQSPLAIALGQNATGQACVYDLKQAPHILVGGSIASGKSNFLDVCICSIIAYSSPDEVQLYLIDYDLQHDGWKSLPHLHNSTVSSRTCDLVHALDLLNSVFLEMATLF